MVFTVYKPSKYLYYSFKWDTWIFLRKPYLTFNLLFIILHNVKML